MKYIIPSSTFVEIYDETFTFWGWVETDKVAIFESGDIHRIGNLEPAKLFYFILPRIVKLDGSFKNRKCLESPMPDPTDWIALPISVKYIAVEEHLIKTKMEL